MTSKELYNEAYRLHYSLADYENALPIYEKVIKQYPDSKEAEYASKQIENINNMSAVEKQRNKEKLIDIKDTYTPQIKNKEKLGFFSFRTLITPDIVKILYVLGFIALTIVGFVMMVNYYETYELFIGLGVILVGNILWRLLCEGIILMFNVHEILDSIEKKIK